MTFEEARKILERELLVVTLESNALKKEAQKKRLNEKFAALNVALEAIDKQIPIKSSSRQCICCGGDVSVYEVSYCCSCGQALDWSDTDD